jgi:chromosomal replication initiation ATPase DnaA
MSGGQQQLVMPFVAPPSYAVEDFIQGDANAEAYRLVTGWPDWPYSLMLLHGPKGSGKTHLAHVFAARTQATMLDVARIGSAPADQLLTGNHCWVIDNLDRVQDQPALAQLINHARARGDYVLLLANAPAARLAFDLPDLTSRLAMLPAVALGAPDDGLLMGVLAKAFADRQLRIAPEMLHYAVARLERSYETVQQFASELDKLSLTRGRAITQALVREALREDG